MLFCNTIGGYKTCTHTCLTALFPGLPRWAGTRKVKPIGILLKQETVSGSGISWAIRKSAPSSRQITMPAPHHSVFYRTDALPAAEPTASKHVVISCQENKIMMCRGSRCQSVKGKEHVSTIPCTEWCSNTVVMRVNLTCKSHILISIFGKKTSIPKTNSSKQRITRTRKAFKSRFNYMMCCNVKRYKRYKNDNFLLTLEIC